MDLETVSKFYRVLGDQTRLKILTLLNSENLCVGDLVERLAISQPSVSQHLRKLKNAKLVKKRKEGAWVYYSLDGESYPFFKQIMKTFVYMSSKVCC